MIVASTRYGTIRRPTALTTNSLVGFVRHVTSTGSSDRIVVAVIGCSVEASVRRHQGSEQRIPDLPTCKPDTLGSFVVPVVAYPGVVAPSPSGSDQAAPGRPARRARS